MFQELQRSFRWSQGVSGVFHGPVVDSRGLRGILGGYRDVSGGLRRLIEPPRVSRVFEGWDLRGGGSMSFWEVGVT